jgi:hypothetical protein
MCRWNSGPARIRRRECYFANQFNCGSRITVYLTAFTSIGLKFGTTSFESASWPNLSGFSNEVCTHEDIVPYYLDRPFMGGIFMAVIHHFQTSRVLHAAPVFKTTRLQRLASIIFVGNRLGAHWPAYVLTPAFYDMNSNYFIPRLR